MPTDGATAIGVDRVSRHYTMGATIVRAVDDVSFTVRQGDFLALLGSSGSGKSTMVRLINRLESHQRGTIVVDGIELADDVKAIEAIRREVGMVFQQFNL